VLLPKGKVVEAEVVKWHIAGSFSPKQGICNNIYWELIFLVPLSLYVASNWLMAEIRKMVYQGT